MTVPNPTAGSSSRLRRHLELVLGAILVPLALCGVSWWFAEPLLEFAAAWWFPRPPAVVAIEAPEPPVNPTVLEVLTTWPESPLSGDPAKRLLLASNLRSAHKLGQVSGYTATFRKQERLGGKLGPEQTLSMKVRNRPFAIYLKFLAPKAGKEVVYAQGHHDNKVIAHNGDWTRRLVPRLAVPPDSAVALADSRHPVTEAGLVNLLDKLLHFRKLDIDDPEASTTLDKVTIPDGRLRLRSIHTHARPDGRRPFARVEVLYDPETQYPIQISSYDWPEPGQSGELELAERYAYDQIKFDAVLTEADFDPQNPDYAFMRF